MGATRDVALNELPIRGISFNPIAASGGTGAITLVPSDSGVIFVNKYVTGATTYTLPAVADCEGKWLWFFNAQTAYAIVVTCATADLGLMVGGGYQTYDKQTSAAEIGACGMVFSDGDYFYFYAIAHTWTAGT
jgi:hypothetical protein